MKNKIFQFLALMFLLSASVYSQIVDTTTLNANLNPIGVTGTLTLDSTKIYKMIGYFFVQSGGTINIPSGTIIRGDKLTKGSLIILRGGKIYARGTSTRPIVFTSNLPPGQRAAGDWGGIIIIGKATINTYTGSDTAICEGVVPDIYYGGHDDNDNSGVLQYVRSEFAGIPLSPNNEINGITFYSVGRGTTVDHLMVSYSGDDSYEWFGGTVNGKYFIAFNGLDDDFDDSFGFRGKMQFCLGVRTPGIADVSGSHFWESDNNEFAQGSSTLFNANSPRTQSLWANITSIGPKEFDTSTISSNFSGTIRERRWSLRSCWDGIFMGWNKGYRIDGIGCMQAAFGDTIKFISNILAGISGNTWDTLSNGGYGFNFPAWGMSPGRQNDTFALNTEVMLVNPYNQTRSTANFMPISGSPAFNHFTDPSTVDPFFTSTNYRGAFGSVDWGSGSWTNWRPDTVDYTHPIGIQPISTEVPANFSLKQNYPNPFNPSTTIKFDISRQSFVLLKVYDVIGRLISTPVNENLQTGKYAISFDGFNLPSGTYFYKINVSSSDGSSWSDTKKMILVK